MITEEEFWEEWKLKMYVVLKSGDKVITKVRMAIPSFARKKVWDILNNGQIDLNVLDVTEEFSFEVGGFLWEFTKKTKK